MTMHSRIHELRLHFGLTQDELGEKLGMTGAAVCRLERGGRDLGSKNIIKICKTFDVSADWLLGLSNDSGWYDDWYKPMNTIKRVTRKKSN